MTGSGTVSNTGTIRDMVKINGTGMVINEAGGIITGPGDGVAALGALSVVNDGTISGNKLGSAVYLEGGSVTDNASGHIARRRTAWPGVGLTALLFVMQREKNK